MFKKGDFYVGNEEEMGPEGAPPDGLETSYPSTPTGCGDDYDEVLDYSDTSLQHADIDDDKRLSSRDGSFLSGGEADFGKEDDGDQDGDTRSNGVLRDEVEFDDDQREARSEDALREIFPDLEGRHLSGDHNEEERLPADSPAQQTNAEGGKTSLPPKQSESALDGMSLLTYFSVPYLISTFYYYLFYYYYYLPPLSLFFFFLKVLASVPKWSHMLERSVDLLMGPRLHVDSLSLLSVVGSLLLIHYVFMKLFLSYHMFLCFLVYNSS